MIETVTVLAVVFLLIVLLVAVFGFRTVIKKGHSSSDPNTERCSLCRQQFPKTQLIERQVGDYRLMYFCGSCIVKLHNDLTSKN
jgi:predicted SprT family Zn-dependent metalloprotease